MTQRSNSAAGFSLIELMVATALLMMITSAVTGALVQMSNSQRTINNRTAMHSGIRGATELLQQEVGQAGRIALPETLGQLRLTAAVAAGCAAVQVNYRDGLFPGVLLATRDGNNAEIVQATAIGVGTPPTITACFDNTHAANTVVEPIGGFANGVVPPAMAPPAGVNFPNGSTETVLKMFGDINGDGNMVYVQYTCDWAGTGNLYRQVVDWDAAPPLPAPTEADVLLRNVVENPDDHPCFEYQLSTITIGGVDTTFVLDVAVTLTVETEQLDPITRTRQRETKALLNVSPRNIFNTWTFAGMSYTDHVQLTPQTILDLIEPVTP